AVEEQQRGLDAAVGQERLAAQLRQVSGGRGGGEQGVGHLSCPRVEWLAALTGASRHEEKCGRGGPSGASKMAGVYRLGGAPFQATGGRTASGRGQAAVSAGDFSGRRSRSRAMHGTLGPENRPAVQSAEPTKGERTRQKIMDLAEDAVMHKGFAAT